MAEPARGRAACGQQRSQLALAAQDVVLESLQADLVQVEVAVGVVAELGAGIEPVAQHRHACRLQLRRRFRACPR